MLSYFPSPTGRFHVISARYTASGLVDRGRNKLPVFVRPRFTTAPAFPRLVHPEIRFEPTPGESQWYVAPSIFGICFWPGPMRREKRVCTGRFMSDGIIHASSGHDYLCATCDDGYAAAITREYLANQCFLSCLGCPKPPRTRFILPAGPVSFRTEVSPLLLNVPPLDSIFCRTIDSDGLYL